MSTLNDNTQKTPLAQSLQALGAAKAQDAVYSQGKSLPSSAVSTDGPGIVTVKFEAVSAAPLPQMKMPIAKTPYIHYPFKAGDPGVAMSADVRLGGLSGLGSGVPNLQDTVGNLSAMMFHPMGTTSDTTLDPDALVLYDNVVCTPDALAFYGGSKVSKQQVTGALSAVTDAAAKAVLTSLLNALEAVGLFDNGTT